MRKRVLALVLTALITTTQFSVVQASTADSSASQSNLQEVVKENQPITENTNQSQTQLDNSQQSTGAETPAEGTGGEVGQPQPAEPEAPVEESPVETPVEEIPIKTTVTKTITPEAQTVNLKVNIETKGIVQFYVVSQIKEATIEVKDANGNVIVNHSGIVGQKYDSGYILSEQKFLQPGTYYFSFSTKETSGNFDLYVGHRDAENDEVEPNDSFETAQNVELNSKEFNGFLTETDITDTYKFQLSKKSIVDINVESSIYGANVEILDSNKKVVFSNEIKEGRSYAPVTAVNSALLNEGTYYFRVTNAYPGKEYGTYKFKLGNRHFTNISSDGWITLEDGRKSYYDAATKNLKVGWLLSGGKYYYFDSQGIMKTGLQQINGAYYYLDGNGIMKTEWVRLNNTWYFFGPSGAAKEGWLRSGTSWYYIGSNGESYKGLKTIGGKIYYFNKDSIMQTGWINEGGTWYYFESSGAAKVNQWLLQGKTWYYLGEQGKMYTGPKTIGGKNYWFNKSGDMQTGWKLIEGHWYYFGDNGAARMSEWALVGKTWYFFNENGIMATGAWEIDGKVYYFNEGGAMQTGWKSIEGDWYYFNEGGDLRTGWLYYGGHWYYLAPNMVTAGIYTIDGTNYKFRADGTWDEHAIIKR